MKRNWLLTLVLGLVGVGVYGGIALATPPSGVTNPPWSPVVGTYAGGIDANAKPATNAGNATAPWQIHISAKGWTDVHILENIIAPGGSFGWHSHPGPSLVIVKTGTLSVYHSPDCKPKDYGPLTPNGTAFVDQGHDIHMVRNNSTTDTADVYVISFVPAGYGRRIDAPNPNPNICPN